MLKREKNKETAHAGRQKYAKYIGTNCVVMHKGSNENRVGQPT